jgi:hypothetical protein
MRKKIEMDDKEFMKRAKSFARERVSMRAAAQEEGVSMQTYKNHLYDVATRLQEAPPLFLKGKKATSKEHIEVVRRSGQRGSGRRLGIPAEVFQTMGWESGTQIRIRKSGKKVILEAIHDVSDEDADESDES